MKFYKIVNPKGHRDMTYTEGLNTDVLPFNPSGDCESGGIYFSREDIFVFIDYGTELYSVEPIGEVYENPDSPKKWKAHAVNLTYIGKVIDNIQLLIDDGANVHVCNNYVLRWAAYDGHTDVVKLLIDAGADIYVHDDYPLRWSAKNGHIDVVKLLLDAGSDVHAMNDCSLRWAAEYGHADVVKLLINAGADVHADDDRAIQWAEEYGHTDVVKLLTKASKKNLKKNLKIKNK